MYAAGDGDHETAENDLNDELIGDDEFDVGADAVEPIIQRPRAGTDQTDHDEMYAPRDGDRKTGGV